MPEPHLRAADSDRAAVATVLGQALAEGRLTVAEYDERLTSAYAARTFGELAPLTADLPGTAAAQVARDVARPAAAVAVPVCAAGWQARTAWASWSSTTLIVLAVWAITSVAAWEFLYFWPFWVIVPWGAMLLMGTHGARARVPGR